MRLNEVQPLSIQPIDRKRFQTTSEQTNNETHKHKKSKSDSDSSSEKSR